MKIHRFRSIPSRHCPVVLRGGRGGFAAVFCFSLFIFLPLLAQSAPAEKTSTRTCRLVFLDGPSNGTLETLHMFDGSNFQQVELPRLNLSPVYKLPGGNLNLQFFPSQPADPKNLPTGAPSVKLPESLTDIYLIVTNDSTNKVAPVRILAINADNTQLGLGEMLFFNLTAKRVGGIIGSQKLDIKPGSRELIREPRSGAGDYPVDLYFLIDGDDFIHPLCETQWRHDPRSRNLVFVINDGPRKSPRIRSFSDFRPAEKENDTAKAVE